MRGWGSQLPCDMQQVDAAAESTQGRKGVRSRPQPCLEARQPGQGKVGGLPSPRWGHTRGGSWTGLLADPGPCTSCFHFVPSLASWLLRLPLRPSSGLSGLDLFMELGPEVTAPQRRDRSSH